MHVSIQAIVFANMLINRNQAPLPNENIGYVLGCMTSEWFLLVYMFTCMQKSVRSSNDFHREPIQHRRFMDRV